jgi:ABC-type uncharacterized transport system
MRAWSWTLGFLGSLLIVSFLVYALRVDHIETPWAIAGGIGAALVGAWLWLDRVSLGQVASSRGAKYTTTALLMVVVAAGVTVALNVLAHRYDKRWDVTSSKRYALSDQTIKVLAGLDREIQVIAFFQTGSPEQSTVEDLAGSYREHTTLLDIQFHDPVREPMLAEQYKITSAAGTMVLVAGDDEQRVESGFGEEDLTNAIVRLTSGKRHLICFTEGHGELDPDDDQGALGMGGVITSLKGQNYESRKVVLLREGAVPADCAALVVADAQVDWLAAEREMLAAWLAGGNPALVMIDPVHAPGLAADLSRYGVVVGNDVVLEQNPSYQLVGGDPSYILLDPQSFDIHEITQAIKGMTLLRIARSVAKGEPKDGLNVIELASTSEFAWAETSLDSDAAPTPDAGLDRIGRVPLAAVVEVTDPAAIVVGSLTASAAPVAGAGLAGVLSGLAGGDAAAATADPSVLVAPPTDPSGLAAAPVDPSGLNTAPEAVTTDVPRKAGGRLIVIGDSDFASNQLADQGSNRDLLLNMVAWMVGEGDQISIRPNDAARGSLTMGLGEGLLVALGVLLVAPGLAIGGAIATWVRRRAR